MNKNNKTLISPSLLVGLIMATPTLQANNGQNSTLKYIDASGQVRIIQDDGQNTAYTANQPDIPPAQEPYQGTYTDQAHVKTTPEAYAATDAYAPQPDIHYTGEQGVHGNSGAPQPEVIYYDAETGEPVPAELVGISYFTGKNQQYTQQPVPAAQTYDTPAIPIAPAQAATQPAHVMQPEQEVLYLDAITGEPLSAAEAQAAMAYNAAQQHASYSAPVMQQAADNFAPPPPSPLPQNLGSGYEMYADTKASADQYDTSMQQAHASTAPQRATVSTAAVVKAVEAGRIDVLSSLQAQGADLRQSDAQGLTYLHRAAAAGHVKMAKYLLRTGLNPNASTSKNWTPLHHAARFGHAEVVAVLLAAGADERQMTSDGFSAKRLAMNAKKYQVAALLR